MSVTALAAATMLSFGAIERASWHGLSDHYTGNKLLATVGPYPFNMADDVHRPGFNGRIWVSRPMIGGQQGPYPMDWCPPGPEAYGAFDNPDATVYARVGHTVVTFGAWERINKGGLSRLERARVYWLRERGYVGGVRTHVNDLYNPLNGGWASADPIVPRATIELSPDMPRIPGRMRVEGPDVSGAAAIVALSGQPIRISWPSNAPADVLARAEKTGGWIGKTEAVASNTK